MTAQANYFRLGLFVLSAVGLLTAGVIVLGAGEMFQKGAMAETYLDQSVEGLNVGSVVKNRGVPIGKVTHIGFVNTKYPQRTVAEEIKFGKYILVEMELNPKALPSKGEIDPEMLQRRIDAGLRIRLAKSGLTGPVYLEADYVDPKTTPPLEIDWDPALPYIPSAPSALSEVISAVERVAKQLEAAQIDKVIANINTLVTDVDLAVNELQIAQTQTELLGLVADARKVFKSILPISASLRKMTRRLDHTMARQQQNIEATIGNLRQFTAHAEATSAEAHQNPSRILFGKPPPRREPGD